MRNKGFTIIEVMLVLCIMAILTAIVIPNITGSISVSSNPEIITQNSVRGRVTVSTYEISDIYIGGRRVRKFCYENLVFMITNEGLIQVFERNLDVSMPATCEDT